MIRVHPDLMACWGLKAVRMWSPRFYRHSYNSRHSRSRETWGFSRSVLLAFDMTKNNQNRFSTFFSSSCRSRRDSHMIPVIRNLVASLNFSGGSKRICIASEGRALQRIMLWCFRTKVVYHVLVQSEYSTWFMHFMLEWVGAWPVFCAAGFAVLFSFHQFQHSLLASGVTCSCGRGT